MNPPQLIGSQLEVDFLLSPPLLYTVGDHWFASVLSENYGIPPPPQPKKKNSLPLGYEQRRKV